MLYKKLLSSPWLILLALLILLSIATPGLQQFTFDASPDTLVVQGDPKLRTYQDMAAEFGGDEFIAVSYRPKNGVLFSSQALKDLGQLQHKIDQISGVSSTYSILDAPLIRSPAVDLELLASQYKTLRNKNTDLALAKSELTTSPLFSNYLVSSEGTATAIRVDLNREKLLESLRKQREVEVDSNALAVIQKQIMQARKDYVYRRQLLIDELKAIRDQHQSAEIYLTGVPMIAADMVNYVRADIRNFGVIVLLVIAALMWVFFRRLKWVFLPLLTSFVAIYLTSSLLGYLQTPVTVVSANFISLLAIISLSFTIHLIVRYRELLNLSPKVDQFDLVLQTMKSKFAPCLYTALTTILAFGSMMSSGIVPIEDFGWMMCVGILISFAISYTLFPAVLLVLPKSSPSESIRTTIRANAVFSALSRHHAAKVVALSILLIIIAIGGVRVVTFENRFVEYFDTGTEVYKGMAFVDQHLGGTVPFELYLKFPAYESNIDPNDDFFSEQVDAYPERYWFDRYKLDQLASLQKRISVEAGVGKLISLATLESLAADFKEEPLTSFELAVLIGALPKGIREEIILPYARPNHGLLRLSGRVNESHPDYRSMELMNRLEAIVAEQDNVVFTGMMVLFNDMLEQLVESQIQTIVYVVLATFLMFTLLLRSLVLSCLALVPNLLAAALVIAFMGYTSIPLDMMTITIAAICVGIGVDDAIHYLHRFRDELTPGTSVNTAISRAHLTIGRAMYFTTMVVMAGFSVLVFSNFIPSVYFGLLTALAMLLALVANLTLLPSLLVLVYGQLGIKPPISSSVATLER